MCGIAGFWNPALPAPEAEAALGAMLDRITHRGPDAEGRFAEPSSGFYFGMRRLSIIDLSGGQQPIWNEAGDIAVILNGEIYNYRSLQDSLKRRGHAFKTQSDTEVLVHLYEEHGEEMVSHLRGMFGFCILDIPKRRIFLARDPFGQKPLYFTEGPDGFAFASELKSLWALPFVEQRIDESRFLDFACWFSLPAPRTHFHGISKLGPGECLSLSLAPGGKSTVRRYWSMRFGGDPFASPDEAGAALDEAMRESIGLHLQADVPVGILLSSGLDSFSVATYTHLVHQMQLVSFTVGFAGGASEAGPAMASAGMLGTAHREITLGPDDLLASLDSVAWHLDEPVGDPAAFALMALCKRARQEVKVLLGGEGSDELFAGYGPRYAGIVETLERSERIRSWLGWLPNPSDPFPASRWARLAKRARQSPVGELASLRREGLPGNVLHPLGLDPAQLLELRRREEAWAAQLGLGQDDPLNLAQRFDMQWQLPESLLMKSDKMSMAASVELRCPFLDAQIAAVAARTSPAQRLDRASGLGKLPLRKAVARYHASAARFPKQGFILPLAEWLRGPLRPAVEDDLLHSGNGAVASLLDRKRLAGAWNAFLQGEPLGQVFYALWLYERWRRNLRSCQGV